MSLSYKDAGVDIDAGNALIERIKSSVKRTQRPEVLTGLGGFGGLFSLAGKSLQDPILVSGTDGVGTKLKLAQQLNMHATIGIDLVAMCVNDVLVQGAEPLFFLDYFATGVLDVDTAATVVDGIAEGCSQAGAALIGGETAEMPGMYAAGEYDLAGFCVGIVERERLIDGSGVRTGDVLIGLASSGIHSNGYSLVNKIINDGQHDLDQDFASSTLGQTLIAPTTIYVKAVLEIVQQAEVHGLCHITGGGLSENLPRILPLDTQASIDLNSWQRPAIFDWIQNQGKVQDQEMLRVFNCGIGMVVIAPQAQAEEVIRLSEQHQIPARVIGNVESGNGPSVVRYD